MEYIKAFEILQLRSTAVKHVALCAAMDLIATCDEETITIYRTMTWEKVYHHVCAQLFHAKLVTALSFSPGGKCLSIGFSDGSINILDIETYDLVPVRFGRSKAVVEAAAVTSIMWQRYGMPAMKPAVNVNHTWLFGGLNQIERAGMPEYCDPDSIDSSTSGSAALGFLQSEMARQQLAQMIQYSLTSTQFLRAHIVGLYPLFTIDLKQSSAVVEGVRFVPGNRLYPSLLLCSSDSRSGSSGGSHLDESQHNSVLASVAFSNSLQGEFQWLERVASLHLVIESSLACLAELVTSCARKWKDSTKVVLPKLSLLQGLMETYQLNMSPVEFCHSLTLCGLWHPTAATAFSQHWNEQGLQRLRSAVDAASRSVIQQLHSTAIPMLTNAVLAARELLAVSELLSRRAAGSTQALVESKDLENLIQLIASLEVILFKLDETLLEARLAREAMLLYIQFVKDCISDVVAGDNVTAAGASSTSATAHRPDIALRPRYQQLFDPRRSRAPRTGPSAQAEHVVGTHLYAYLQDAPDNIHGTPASGAAGAAAAAVVEAQQVSDFASCQQKLISNKLKLPISSAHDAAALEQIQKHASRLAEEDLSRRIYPSSLHTAPPAPVAAEVFQEQQVVALNDAAKTHSSLVPAFPEPASLIHHIKNARRIFQRDCNVTHDRLSSQLQQQHAKQTLSNTINTTIAAATTTTTSSSKQDQTTGTGCNGAGISTMVPATATALGVWLQVSSTNKCTTNPDSSSSSSSSTANGSRMEEEEEEEEDAGNAESDSDEEEDDDELRTHFKECLMSVRVDPMEGTCRDYAISISARELHTSQLTSRRNDDDNDDDDDDDDDDEKNDLIRTISTPVVAILSLSSLLCATVRTKRSSSSSAAVQGEAEKEPEQLLGAPTADLVRSCHCSLYLRPRKEQARCDVSAVFALELEGNRAGARNSIDASATSTASGGSVLLLVRVPLSRLKFTPSNDGSRIGVGVNAVTGSGVRCRKLPALIREINLLATCGERGVACVLGTQQQSGAGRLVVIDLEAEEEEDEEEDEEEEEDDDDGIKNADEERGSGFCNGEDEADKENSYQGDR